MRKIKPVLISVITIVIFAGALAIGMTTDWWQTEGRKTPLSAEKGHGVNQTQRENENEIQSDHQSEPSTYNDDEKNALAETDHQQTEVKGSSTVQDALDLGISLAELEAILEGPIEDTNASIKETAQSRGLKFGEVKDTLNGLLN